MTMIAHWVKFVKRSDLVQSGLVGGWQNAMIAFSADILIRFEGCGVQFVIKYFDVDGI